MGGARLTKEFANERPGFEWFKVINVFTSSNENNRTFGCCHSEINGNNRMKKW